MKKKALVCDRCNRVISTNFKEEKIVCCICNSDLCSDCAEYMFDDLFGEKFIFCRTCSDNFDEFGKKDNDILYKKFGKDFIETIKKLMMTNQMSGNKK